MRLKTTEVAKWRAERALKNSGRCGLCQLPIVSPVADHDHHTGQMRDAICRSCNSGLGAVERARVRFGIKNLQAFLHGTATYLQRHETPQHNLLHPTHRTLEEKRLRVNARAKKARATKKAA